MTTDSIFENTEVAFKLKSDSQLERAYFLFKMIANEPLVKIGTVVTKFALKAHLPVEGLIRSTVFDHFCGGINENDCMPVVESLSKLGVKSVLDYSVEGKEGEEQFNSTLNKVIKLTAFSKIKNSMPFSVFKPSGLGRFELFQKVTENIELSNQEVIEWSQVKKRFDVASNSASQANIKLLIDAEESWMQRAADELCTDLMAKYNQKRVVVFNTLQCYRWDRLDYLKEEHKKALANGYKLGYKIVRGAYLEKENERAEAMGYKSPICETKEATDTCFNEVLNYILNNLSEIELFIGTHNEESTSLAIHQMKEKKIAKNDSRVWFGQLYGMSDHITFNLAKLGYGVAKYIPFGPVKDVMPYLIRRAEENTSVTGQTSRELSLIKKEKQRRKL
ncbi:proline dehydrogenase family protein [Flavobacteriaceae bacterium]|nr:proline dehydrogenase family protein [Flavobacteriaceae bacterium]MDB4591380.1 proline dehydrogenase family protein [Flavobacteriaceae bacterium]MDC6467634.1 proline dehydrogenase family protein [Flavobacteriaceae bacterium]